MSLELQQNPASIVASLRHMLPRMEGIKADQPVLSFGLQAIDAYLPSGGLVFGAVHEIAPESADQFPAAFGFIFALLGRIPRNGQSMLVMSSKGIADWGRPHGHGFKAFGFDPGRLVLVDAGSERQTLWTLEECLRSGGPVAVVGVLGKELDLKASQRLQVAARHSGTPLLLLRPSRSSGASAATTRWLVGARSGVRDRFGLVTHWQWQVSLDRCRNGRPGAWVVEWNHVAHRFSLAAEMADPALPRKPVALTRIRATG